MGLLDKLRGKRGGGDDDDNDDLDELEEESLDDDEGSSGGLLGRMRQKISRSRKDDEDEDEDDEDDDDGDGDGDGDGEDDGGSSGILGRMRRKLKRGNEDDEEDEDELAPSPAETAGDGTPIPVTVISPPPDAADEGETPTLDTPGGGQTSEASTEPALQGAAATAGYIVDTPDGNGAEADVAGESAGESSGGDAQEENAAPDEGAKGGSDGNGGSGLDLADLFETEEEVDEAFQDLVDSVGDVAASDLATQLQEILASLNNRG